eukprot:scaffold167495_cov19-Tisochrysis_lutea.AAC.1
MKVKAFLASVGAKHDQNVSDLQFALIKLCLHDGAGGHFAASVFKARAPNDGLNSQGGGAQGGAKDAFEVLDHKTCHRYVIR